MKHTINRAESMAVIVVVKQFGTLNRRIAAAMDLEYIYSGLQGAAAGSKTGGCLQQDQSPILLMV